MAAPGDSPATPRLWFAQALRAAACLTVVVMHYMGTFVVVPRVVAAVGLFPPLPEMVWPAYLQPVVWLYSFRVEPSGVAVALFFLVSGFVIPYSLERTSLGGFVVRRFFRLYPTLWLVQVFLLGLLAFQAWRHGFSFPYDATAIRSNALLVNPYLGYPFIETVCWTLVVEELFYAICALCAWRDALDKPLTLVLAGVALTGLALAGAQITPANGMPRWQMASYWLGRNATFVVFIFIGVVLHYLHRGTWRPRVGLPLILCLLGLFVMCCTLGTLGQSEEGTIYIRAGLLALAMFVPLQMTERWLPYSRWVDRLAEISYPLYLVHATLGYILIREVYLATASLYLGFAVAFAVALVLAALLHRFVERPANALGKRLAARPWGRVPAGERGGIEYDGGKITLPYPPGYVHGSSR